MDNLKNYRDRIIATIIIIVLLFVIGFTNTGRKTMSFFERITGDLLSPVLSTTSYIGNTVAEGVNTLRTLPDLKYENEYLQKENARLQEENQRLNDIVSRTEYLKSEYDLVKNSEDELIKAEVIGKEPGEWFDRIIVNKGKNDGIGINDTVVVGIKSSENVIVQGLVGRVYDIGDNWSKIVTIMEESNSVAFKNIRTQDGGVLKGFTEGLMEGYLFYNQSDIVADDRLYTSGIGDMYKGDVYIGRVSNVISDEQDMKKKIQVTPAVDFKKLYRVFIIKSDVKYDEAN
ncbi:MAG: rod shape-determining protein MreC [Tissierellia bacterium]|nr:rod shape-determining protein MreC [Tissierellia bacterium]